MLLACSGERFILIRLRSVAAIFSYFLAGTGGGFAKGNGSSRRRSSFKVALKRGLEFQVSLNVLRILIRVT